jgi:hypothetical protein
MSGVSGDSFGPPHAKGDAKERADLSVDDALIADHVQLDGLFRNLRLLVEDWDAKSAAVQEAFERRLVRHMTWEEESLFPALGAADGGCQRRIESLVIDHARIREKLLELASGIRESRWTDAAQSADDLWVLLEGHNRDEEKGVYTDADRMIPATERFRLLSRWRSEG